MNEASTKTDEVLRRLTEVLDVLSKISEDLQDIAKSLRTVTPRTVPVASKSASVTPTSTTLATPAAQPIGKGVEDVRMMFTKELEEMLRFEDEEGFIKITPRQYLGSDNFAKIASIIRGAGGEYVSAGRDSHFRVPK